MTKYLTEGRGDLSALVATTGTAVPYVQSGTPANSGVTVANATRYLFPFGSERSPFVTETSDISIVLRWAAAVSGTLTIEATNIPATFSGQGQGGADLSDYEITTPGWVLFNPTAAGALYAAATGTGNSFTALTLTLGGTNAGTAIINIPDFAFLRGRLNLNVTVGGIIRATMHGKLGA